jgi:ATP-dependent exoDNAse (exonuclease V) beta subunit
MAKFISRRLTTRLHGTITLVRTYRSYGRVDLITEWEGKLSVIDFKTSKRLKTEDKIQDYFAQCVAYAMMYEERVEASSRSDCDSNGSRE